jgi:hypothetical protein
MQEIDIYQMTARLEAEVMARRAEQAAARDEHAPHQHRPLRARLVAALALLGLYTGMPFSTMI